MNFLNFSFDLDFVDFYDEYAIHPDDWHYFVSTLISEGYKVSITTKEPGKGEAVYITDVWAGTQGGEVCLSVWERNFPLAFRVASLLVSLAKANNQTWAEAKEQLDAEQKARMKAFKEFHRQK